jgi:hypothetical protein
MQCARAKANAAANNSEKEDAKACSGTFSVVSIEDL